MKALLKSERRDIIIFITCSVLIFFLVLFKEQFIGRELDKKIKIRYTSNLFRTTESDYQEFNIQKDSINHRNKVWVFNPKGNGRLQYIKLRDSLFGIENLFYKSFGEDSFTIHLLFDKLENREFKLSNSNTSLIAYTWNNFDKQNLINYYKNIPKHEVFPYKIFLTRKYFNKYVDSIYLKICSDDEAIDCFSLAFEAKNY